MITIEPPIYHIRGVTVFRDHANPDLHYYLPGAPRLARSGDAAAFTLFKFRRDLTDNPALDPTRARGAGLAQFEVEIPPANVAALTAEVAQPVGAQQRQREPGPLPLRRGARARRPLLAGQAGGGPGGDPPRAPRRPPPRGVRPGSHRGRGHVVRAGGPGRAAARRGGLRDAFPRPHSRAARAGDDGLRAHLRPLLGLGGIHVLRVGSPRPGPDLADRARFREDPDHLVHRRRGPEAPAADGDGPGEGTHRA